MVHILIPRCQYILEKIIFLALKKVLLSSLPFFVELAYLALNRFFFGLLALPSVWWPNEFLLVWWANEYPFAYLAMGMTANKWTACRRPKVIPGYLPGFIELQKRVQMVWKLCPAMQMHQQPLFLPFFFLWKVTFLTVSAEFYRHFIASVTNSLSCEKVWKQCDGNEQAEVCTAKN